MIQKSVTIDFLVSKFSQIYKLYMFSTQKIKEKESA